MPRLPKPRQSFREMEAGAAPTLEPRRFAPCCRTQHRTSSGDCSALLVEVRALLLRAEMRQIVLDPQLRTGLLDELLDLSPTCQRLLPTKLNSRYLVSEALRLIVI